MLAALTSPGSPVPLDLPVVHAGASVPQVFGFVPTARNCLAVGMPDSPAAAVLLLLGMLAVTYALVTTFIKVGVPLPSRHPDDEDEGDGTDEDGEPRGLDTPDPDWPTETVPDPQDLEPERDATPPSEKAHLAREPISIETVRVRDHYLTLGDTASAVMKAFRPNEGETVPLVERNAAGQARYVSRTYRIGRRPLTIVLERESPDEPLRLVRLEVGQ